MERASIICVDDEKSILDSLKAQLREQFDNEFDIEIAESAEEGLEIYHELVDEGVEIPLVISDQIMPGMKGDEFLERIYNEDDYIKTVMLTGQAGLNDVARAVNKANLFRYIGKPWDKTDLILTISTAIQSYYDAKEIDEKNRELLEYKEHLEKLVEKRTRKLESQNKIIEAKNVELNGQKRLVEQKNEEITSSIHYAKKIQKAILPQSQHIEKILGEHFIFYQPKDIIGGDFYWLSRRDNDVIIAAADCTGHGVPGALLSMLGISFLDRAVNYLNIRESDKILNNVREEVVRSLHQDSGELTDGMDISLLVLDLDKLSVQFSGALNSAFLVRNNEIIELKGDRIPIGHHPKMDEKFTSRKEKLEHGDMLYMLSDGFPDQFGGQENKKFRMKEFRKLLLEIYTKPIAEQQKIVKTVFSEWMGKNSQTDDVMVMGIKV